MKKVILKRVIHRDELRIAIVFDYDKELLSIVKGISEARFSNTNKFWYVDDSEEKLREVLETLRDKVEVDISGISYRSAPVERTGGKDKEETVLSEAKTENNPGDETTDFRQNSATIRVKRYSPVEFRINHRSSRFIIKFTGLYRQEWVDEIRSYGKFSYDSKRKEFLLPWSKLKVDSLSDYFSREGVEVRVIKPEIDEKTKEIRRNFSDEVRSRVMNNYGYEGIDLLHRHLEDHRYSVRTIESYVALLELYFKFFYDRNPYEITQNEVCDFINNFIIRNGFSASYQNQMVSAIRLYYEISKQGKIVPQLLERPRRGKSLPKVFSKEEVSRILNSAGNTKHKLLLWIIYSCGLRRSEVTNIRLDDIDRTRSIIHIREGKGGVDRIVPVSDKVWHKIDEYLNSYSPCNYLFEGPAGGKYSNESVYSVFRTAMKKAGIQKDVGVHSLRHSYATHLHESGLDIRYIQELLGHKSTRTTEIYTHVSRRNLITVKSPIEDLDVK
jgi:integrase/recombinase XerD